MLCFRPAPASPMPLSRTFLAVLPLRRPKLPLRGSSSSLENPHTPVDQMPHTPLSPSEALRAPRPQSKRQSLWLAARDSGASHTAVSRGAREIRFQLGPQLRRRTRVSLHTPLEPISATNPVVNHRLDPRAACPLSTLPRRLPYRLTKRAPRKLSNSSSHDGASSPLSSNRSMPFASSGLTYYKGMSRHAGWLASLVTVALRWWHLIEASSLLNVE